MYKSYSYNNMPQPLKPEPKAEPKPAAVPIHENTEKKTVPKKQEKIGILSRLENDDIILIIIIALLLFNDCDDKLLLIALAYIFFSDYFN